MLENPPFFRFEAFSCWNSIEFMSNFYGAGLQKAIERYHTKAYVLPNAAKEAPLAATMLWFVMQFVLGIRALRSPAFWTTSSMESR